MPRKLRVQYPGAIYHVMSRGDRREDIFLDDVAIVALRLRRETSLSLKRIAARLHLGSPRSAGERLRQWIQNQALSEGQRQAEPGI